jgi:hypothetical protein
LPSGTGDIDTALEYTPVFLEEEVQVGVAVPTRPISVHFSTPSKDDGWVHISTISTQAKVGGHSSDEGMRWASFP